MFRRRKKRNEDEGPYVEHILLSDEQARPLVLAATGKPYLIIVRNETDDGYIVHSTEGFNIATLFSCIDNIIRANKDDKEMQSAFADSIIELSKTLSCTEAE